MQVSQSSGISWRMNVTRNVTGNTFNIGLNSVNLNEIENQEIINTAKYTSL